VTAAGLIARIVDVEAFALENACKLMTHQMPDGGIDRAIAVADFGASTTTFSVLRNLKIVYTRDFNFGGNQLTEEIMRTYGLSLEEAGRAKKEGGLPANFQTDVLDPFIDDMTQQISRSLQFYLASGSGREQPEKILLCGGCANIPGVAEVVQSRIGVPAERGDPLGQMKLSSRARAQAVQRDATALLTACGLALRSFD
jgi:type IV pilus assembly protein PilM